MLDKDRKKKSVNMNPIGTHRCEVINMEIYRKI